jgi:hypothetical protein
LGRDRGTANRDCGGEIIGGTPPHRDHDLDRAGAAGRARAGGAGLGTDQSPGRSRARGDGFYFAFVNYTTLGYGDILPAPEWRMLGPITALNGILLFGWSTAVIFEVLRTSSGALRDLPTQS